MSTAPVIGVFDSGFGGLTVLRALSRLMPWANYLYLGDTARLPYGSKSPKTVARYALESARFLHGQGAQHLVVACNTATALALTEIEDALPIPVTGVIAPGAAACGEGDVLVLATSATVQSGAYTRVLTGLGRGVTEMACPLLVPLVEEGWLDATPETAEVTAKVLEIYLESARLRAPGARSLLLGCTHYPLLTKPIAKALEELNYPLAIVDAADATARAVACCFPHEAHEGSGAMRFFATDSPDKFERLGARFLGRDLGRVALVDLGG